MMTPMVDIVFLLIIFFLVSSHMKQQERTTELALPVAPTSVEDDDPSRPRITINIEESGRLVIGGRAVSPDSLASFLEQAKHQKGDDFEVRIRASRAVMYQGVEPVLVACTDARIWNVSFAVYREERN